MGARRADQPVRPKVKINPPESLGLGSALVIKGIYTIIKGYRWIKHNSPGLKTLVLCVEVRLGMRSRLLVGLSDSQQAHS